MTVTSKWVALHEVSDYLAKGWREVQIIGGPDDAALMVSPEELASEPAKVETTADRIAADLKSGTFRGVSAFPVGHCPTCGELVAPWNKHAKYEGGYTCQPAKALEEEAREAAVAFWNEQPVHPRFSGDDFIHGYLAAATLREKEIEKLRALLEKLQKDAALYAEYVRRNPPVGMRDETEREIATLRARVEELEGMVPKWADANEAPRLEDLGWLRAYDDKCGDDPRMWLMCMVPPIPVPETKP